MTKKTNIYLVTRTDSADYDEHRAVVVYANNEAEAREYFRRIQNHDEPEIKLPAKPVYQNYPKLCEDSVLNVVELARNVVRKTPTNSICEDFLHG